MSGDLLVAADMNKFTRAHIGRVSYASGTMWHTKCSIPTGQSVRYSLSFPPGWLGKTDDNDLYFRGSRGMVPIFKSERVSSASRRCLFFLYLMAAAAGPSIASGMSRRQVDLKLRVMPGADRRHEQCVVELRKSSGDYVFMTNVMTGDVVRFKHLDPDIYIVSLLSKTA